MVDLGIHRTVLYVLNTVRRLKTVVGNGSKSGKIHQIPEAKTDAYPE